MSSVAQGLKRLTKVTAKATAETQTAVDRILWGKGAATYQATTAVASQGASGSYTTATVGATNGTYSQVNPNKSGNPFADAGVFPFLDALISIPLCDVVTYLQSQLGGPQPRQQNPDFLHKSLYILQDNASAVKNAIDVFTGFPNTIITGYSAIKPAATTVTNATANSGSYYGGQGVNAFTSASAAFLSGSAVSQYNLKNLLDYITAVFASSLKGTDGKDILTPEDNDQLAQLIPGYNGPMSLLTNFIGKYGKYTDYTQIQGSDYQQLLKDIKTVRGVCQVIENFNLNPASAVALLATSAPANIRESIQKIESLIASDDIINSLKFVDSSVQSFSRSIKLAQKQISTGQVIIKIAILIIKVFEVIVNFLLALPIPTMFSTVGVSVSFSKIQKEFDSFIDDLIALLKQVNALMSVIVSFLRYLQSNTQQLIDRLNIIIADITKCKAAPADISKQLNDSSGQLNTLNEELTAYLKQYDSNSNPGTVTFGNYTIQVIDEEVVDTTIAHKRRRGVAIDSSGIAVLQSDLTFATDLNVIINEVKVKLLNAGLVGPEAGTVDPNVVVISTSLTFLNSNNLPLGTTGVLAGMPEAPLELQSFVNSLPGGKKLRQRTKNQLQGAQTNLKSNIAVQGRLANSAFAPK